MKVLLDAPIKEMSGSLSKGRGIVLSNWRGVNIARQYAIPRNPQSTDQVLIRNILTQCAQAFQSISLVQKAAWAAYAALNPSTWKGTDYQIPEISAYVRINSYRLIAGEAISDDPPTDTADFVATSLTSVAYATGATTLTIVFAHSAAVITNKNWAIYITASLPSGVTSVKSGQYRLCDGVTATSIIAVEATPQTAVITTPRFANWTTLDYMSIMWRPLSPEFDPGTVFTAKDQITVT